MVALLAAGTAIGNSWPPQSDDFILYPSVLNASGGALCGAPDHDLMFTLGENVVGASGNADFQLWSGFRFLRRVTVLCPQWTAIDETDQPEIRATMLHPAYPNPATGQLQIPYDIGTTENVRLTIFDIQGREIRSFDRGQLEEGRYELTWDGRDGDGNNVATGIYFTQLEAGDMKFVKRVVVFR